MTGVISRLKPWAKALRRDILALWFAARNSTTPWYARAVAACVAAYALSPVDLIPDFVPVLGYLDDLLIVPLGVLLAIRLIPPDILAAARRKALDTPRMISHAGLVGIVTIWIVAGLALARLLWP